MANAVILFTLLMFLVHVANARKQSNYEETAEYIVKTVIARYEKKAQSLADTYIFPYLVKNTKDLISFAFFVIKISIFFTADACYAVKVFFIFAAYFCVVTVGIFIILLLMPIIRNTLFGLVHNGWQSPISSPGGVVTSTSNEQTTLTSTPISRTPFTMPSSSEEERTTSSNEEGTTFNTANERGTSVLSSGRTTFTSTNQQRNRITIPQRLESIPLLTDEEWLSLLRLTVTEGRISISVSERNERISFEWEKTTETSLCLVCCEEESHLVKLPPCGHQYICQSCAETIIQMGPARCPFCRSTIIPKVK